jgi:aldehyde:ferredoxin oxidoreductase
MTFAGIDLRPLKGCSLAAVTCTRGGDIEEGICIPEIAGMPPEECKRLYGSEEIADPTTYNKKAETVYLSEVEATITDCVEICKFSTRFLCQELKVEDMGELFRAATGMELDTKSLHDAADRIYNLERAFLVREGITKKDDCLIGPWGEEPVKSGPFKGERIDPKKFRRMLEEYYALRGWDKKTGIPTRAVLERLGLQRVADDLEKMEKLPGSK